MQETSHLTHPSPLLSPPPQLGNNVPATLWNQPFSSKVGGVFPSSSLFYLSWSSFWVQRGRLPVLFDHLLSPFLSIDEKALFTLSFPVPTREFCRHRPFIRRNFSLIHQSELPYLSSLLLHSSFYRYQSRAPYGRKKWTVYLIEGHDHNSTSSLVDQGDTRDSTSIWRSIQFVFITFFP